MKAKIITELEADFGVIRSTEKKIIKEFPHHDDVGGLFFTLQTHYIYPTFSAIDYNDSFLINRPRHALFTLYKGVWTIETAGDYESRIDEMLNVLIDTFGGERG